MILIADSGATKTDWCLGETQASARVTRTTGINPFHQSEEEILSVLSQELMPTISASADAFSAVYFYGSGCTPEQSVRVRGILGNMFRNARITVESDLTGAARALCGSEKGIACILGTGSNSGLYDGKRIVSNVPPLGYILGDEGSGAYIGKRFVGDCLKGLLPDDLRQALLDGLGLSMPQLIDRVYRQPQVNRFLASVTPIIYRYKERPEVKALLTDCFGEFFRRNVWPYRNLLSAEDGTCLLPPVSFVGSVAWYFRKEVEESARSCGLQVGRFLKEPLGDLAGYHFSMT